MRTIPYDITPGTPIKGMGMEANLANLEASQKSLAAMQKLIEAAQADLSALQKEIAAARSSHATGVDYPSLDARLETIEENEGGSLTVKTADAQTFTGVRVIVLPFKGGSFDAATGTLTFPTGVDGGTF